MRVVLCLCLCCVVSCRGPGERTPSNQPAGSSAVDEAGFTPPTAISEEAGQALLDVLPFSDQQDFEDAKRGFVARDEAMVVKDAEGNVVWNMPEYDFVKGGAPPSVNPSLWRQAKLNGMHGLYKVTEGVHQLRGFDLANMTLVDSDNGWIVIDPLTSTETGAHAIAFARKHLGDKQIMGVIFTHSHVDHFGGVLGMLSAKDAKARSVPIVAPSGFIEEATSENIMAGIAMARRSFFMYGARLPRSPRGHVDTGLGKTPAYGTIGILEPTIVVQSTPEKHVLDGVEFVFQNVPGSEAPAEMTFYVPKHNMFCGAELASHTMHNLYTPRGAKVRDALKWSAYIDEALTLFPDAEVFIGTHSWPTWGNARIVEFLEQQRDTYKFIHDQTMGRAIAGMTPREIAEELELPEALRNTFANRGYYGTLSHNSKAVYQRYFGWFDGNPANLNPLPPEESAKKYVALMGGANPVLDKAQAAFDKGEYRWVAELVNHVVFADPGNTKAKSLLARAYDQLGYVAESGPWRDIYLSGAFELRHGGPEEGFDMARALAMIKHAPIERFFEAMATRLNADKAEGKKLTINMVFTDLGETHVLRLNNSVLRHEKGERDKNADATLNVTHDLYLKMALNKAGLKDTLLSDDLKVQGSRLKLLSFLRLFDKPDGKFNIVTP